MKSLYILPFDHRASYAKFFNLNDQQLTPEQTALLADYKHVVYEGTLEAIKLGAPKDQVVVLVDEQFGSQVLRDAKTDGIGRAVSTEKSGQEEFDFQNGSEFGAHIKDLQPNYVKVLVRYNPAGDKEMNKRQAARLKQMSDFCQQNGYTFLFELLVPATAEQKTQCEASGQNYETTLRYQGMIGAINELYAAGVEPQIWKIEGLEVLEQMETVIKATQADGRSKVGTIVLGRGESAEKVKMWLSVAANIPGVIGFAVGRTIWKQSLLDYSTKLITREQAAGQIAKNFKEFIDIFEQAKKK